MQNAYLDIELCVADSLGQRLVDVLRPFSENTYFCAKGCSCGRGEWCDTQHSLNY